MAVTRVVTAPIPHILVVPILGSPEIWRSCTHTRGIKASAIHQMLVRPRTSLVMLRRSLCRAFDMGTRRPRKFIHPCRNPLARARGRHGRIARPTLVVGRRPPHRRGLCRCDARTVGAQGGHSAGDSASERRRGRGRGSEHESRYYRGQHNTLPGPPQASRTGTSRDSGSGLPAEILQAT